MTGSSYQVSGTNGLPLHLLNTYRIRTPDTEAHSSHPTHNTAGGNMIIAYGIPWPLDFRRERTAPRATIRLWLTSHSLAHVSNTSTETTVSTIPTDQCLLEIRNWPRDFKTTQNPRWYSAQAKYQHGGRIKRPSLKRDTAGIDPPFL